MPGLPTTAFRAVGQDDAVPDGFAVRAVVRGPAAQPLNVYEVQAADGSHSITGQAEAVAEHRVRPLGARYPVSFTALGHVRIYRWPA
jgi:hypothetical protein